MSLNIRKKGDCMDNINSYLKNRFKMNLIVAFVFLLISSIFSIFIFKDIAVLKLGVTIVLVIVYRGIKVLHICKKKRYTAIECDLLMIEPDETRGLIKTKINGWKYTFHRIDTDEIIQLEYKNKLYGVELYKSYYLLYEGCDLTVFEACKLIGMVKK